MGNFFKHLIAIIFFAGLFDIALLPYPPGNTEPAKKHYPLLPFASDFGGSFELVTHDGSKITQERFLGEYSLLYFGFTNCADICPTTLNSVSIALDELAKQNSRPKTYFVNLDYENTSLMELAEYVGAFHPKIKGVQGKAASISNAAAAFGVRYKKVINDDGTTTLVHSGKIFLIGPTKKVLAYFPHDADPDWIVQTVLDFIDSNGN